MERHFIVAAQTDSGIVKKINQDSLTVKVAQTNHGEIAFAVLCDGMGGLELGEIASSHVVKKFESWFHNDLMDWMNAKRDVNNLFQQWNQLIHTCNEEIVSYEKKIDSCMGTTLTVLLLVEDHYYIAHVGDCRVYEMLDGIRQITKDQTFVAREVTLGHMSEQQANTDERRNVLLQCIGVNSDVNPDFIQGTLAKNMSLLLCTDGFRHEITMQEILQYAHVNVMQEMNTDFINQDLQMCERERINRIMDQQISYLIELNKSRNEKDNISAILLQVV